MGYTHYFDWKKVEGKAKIFSIKKDVQDDVLTVIERHKDVLDPKYTVDGGLVVINGNPAYETLYIEAGVSGFCKTNHYSYDIAVCEILLVFKYHYGESFELSSDGFWVSKEDLSKKILDGVWNQALKNVKERFGYEFELIPIIDGNYYHFEIKAIKLFNKLKILEGEEITIEYKGNKFVVTASPFHDDLLALRAGNDEDGYDEIALIDSLDCISQFV